MIVPAFFMECSVKDFRRENGVSVFNEVGRHSPVRPTAGVGRRGRDVHQRQPELESLYQIRESLTKLRASERSEG